MGFLGGERANSAAASQASAAMGFTKEQMQNRHQWEVEDLKRAGLNPTLSAGGTPSIGGSAQAPVVDSISKGFSSAMDVANLNNLKSQNQLIREQVKKTAAETIATAADARRLGAIADKEEISKLPYNLAKEYLLPQAKSSAASVSDAVKKMVPSGIKVKFGDKGVYQ